ncbi:MAG: sigma-70 family RNA polymerase sigma factor [Ktedonobacterales bacterium]
MAHETALGEHHQAEGVAEAMAERSRFTALVSPHTRDMLRMAAALVGVTEAEDAAQEAALRAWQAWPTLRDEAATRGWLLRITANVCYQWRRGTFGRAFRLTEPLPADSQPGAGFGDLAELGLLQGDPGASGPTSALDLRQAVNRLDPQARLIVVLRYYAGMDASEIGQMLDAPPATIRTRLRRALETLRKQLAPPGANTVYH